MAEHAAPRNGRRAPRAPGSPGDAAHVDDVETPAPVHAGEQVRRCAHGAPGALRRAAVRRRRSRVPRSDRGGVIVEFAAVVPFLLLALALVWQVVLVGITSMYASHASAEAARQAAVTPDDAERIDEEARKRVRPPWDAEDMMTVEIVERGDGRFAQVTLAMPIFLPGAAGPWDVTGESAVVQEVDPRGGSDGGTGDDAAGDAPDADGGRGDDT